MDYIVIKSSVQEYSHKMLYHVKLKPGVPEEKKLLEESGNDDRIEPYYHEAIKQKLGEDFELLAIADPRAWPYAAEVFVQKIVGLGQ